MMQSLVVSVFLLSSISESLKLVSTPSTTPKSSNVTFHDRRVETDMNSTWCTPFCYTKTILQYQYRVPLQACQLAGCYGNGHRTNGEAPTYEYLEMRGYKKDVSTCDNSELDFIHAFRSVSDKPIACGTCVDIVGMGSGGLSTKDGKNYFTIYDDEKNCIDGTDPRQSFKYGGSDECLRENVEQDFMDGEVPEFRNKFCDFAYQSFTISRGASLEDCEKKCLDTANCKAISLFFETGYCRGCKHTFEEGIETGVAKNKYWSGVTDHTEYSYFYKREHRAYYGVVNKALPDCVTP